MKLLIHRSGAFGDVLITTPLIRHIHSQGHKIVYIANERGVQVLKNNPHIEKLILQKTNEVPINALSENLLWHQRKNKCDKVLDLSESLEVALSQHPRGPDYKLPKYERFKRFNRNFYEYAFEFSKESWEGVDLKPELFFEDGEIREAQKYLKKDKYNILIGMSGSGTNKAYPHMEALAYKICDNFPNTHIITVGDERCQMIEPQLEGRITNLSGKIPMRTSMALTSITNLVISPDTGLLHASGCYHTPKIGILGHNTVECITKHFVNDYSVQADTSLAECSPCFYLIYNMKLQCPIDHDTGGAMCMSAGLPMERVFERVKLAYAKS